jgi:hypothetical protein
MMIRRKVLASLGLAVVVALAVASVPRAAEGQTSGGALQRILDLLTSFGDVSRSWSAALPVDERFVVLAAFNDEAVLDKNTGLVWQRSPLPDARHWPSAQYACLNSRVGGQMGWRMPSISEMTSLVDTTRDNPAFPEGSPMQIGDHAFFWTSTQRVLFDDLAWGVNLRDGFVDDYEFFLNASVWCVRGGTNSDDH